MRTTWCHLGTGPKDIIRWQGARQVLDHGRQRKARGAVALAMKVNKGTRT